MLSAAASAIPRLRWAAPPRHTSSRTQWLLLRQRPLYSSSTSPNAAAAGPGPLEPPDLSRLAKSARISLSSQEAEAFAPKIQQVVDWFGQLQAVDLESIEPSLRAALEAPIGSPWVEGDGGSVRADVFRVVARFLFFQAALPPPPLHLPTVQDTAVGSSLREDKAEPFANRDAIIEALPSYDDPYIKVPRVLNSE